MPVITGPHNNADIFLSVGIIDFLSVGIIDSDVSLGMDVLTTGLLVVQNGQFSFSY